MANFSVVINVVKEEVPLLPRVLNSIVGLADEIVLIDMTEGDENLKQISEKYNAKIYSHKLSNFVESARNYGISKSTGNWILILDPDEEVPKTLAEKLKYLIQKNEADYFRLPRKNIIFGKWIMHARWFPDYNIRFFKRSKVFWDEKIHSIPITKGIGADVDAKEEYAIVHHNYQSISQFMTRLDRYTDVQSAELARKNYRFIWKDLVGKPVSEFISRYFAGEGYRDGLHGLALCGLQAFSEGLVYLKVWEKEKFLEQAISPLEISREFGKAQAETNWWINDALIKGSSVIASLPLRIKRKIFKKNG